MNWNLKIVLIMLAVVFIGAFFAIGFLKERIETNLNELAHLKISNVDLSNVADGTYTGSYRVFPISAEVKVTVKDNKFSAIKLVEHKNGKGAAAEKIPDEVIKAQSIDIDVISGATYSSKVILKAIQNAFAP